MKNDFRIGKTLMLLFMLCLFPVGMLAQNVLKGTVTDADGEPVIGASVREVGTSNGTITDISGQFSINAPANMLTKTYGKYENTESKATDIAVPCL